ncbi:heat shock protein 75 kDa, mitochondrial precursor [Thraustotheca clavata]|uniref:Heat shock protein 75 kDa, mitochondrial n=1 Tax=Thraustotheca clavata TaxID=74557 RepID=A0A1W0A9T8_9STRA|nr:heat shock protein 75 kDa, mitochondrial precursor [Thraustotheca clavata]
MLRHSFSKLRPHVLRVLPKGNASVSRTFQGIQRVSPVVWRHANALRSFSTEASTSKHEFQAETRQLLDIVTHSIYTDKEVFVRELISNASDALEKFRHHQAVGSNILNPELAPKIIITTDTVNNTLTIEDTGIGMTKEELVMNLGTIARSGSKAFMEQLKTDASSETTAAATGIIGKFGVGFYSAFMVADKVQVFSRSALNGDKGHVWSSDGSGSFEVAEAEEAGRGSKIVIHMKDSCKDFATPEKVESIIKKYSNFVAFPILLNEQEVNVVQALWAKPADEISDEQYSEFYKFIANAFDEPLYRLHFKADAPIELKTLFFIGSTHTEKHGYARLEPGVSLYSRKVLIERHSPDILPEWMRFVRGVVDSEDLPLSLSREKMQDSRLLAKMKDVLTRRILKFLDERARKEPEKYDEFFKEFGMFIKEGVCMDFQNKAGLSKLLRYESSAMDEGKTTSLDEYVSRAAPDQSEIYYICAPSREMALQSPYYEAFKKTKKEVIFAYHPVDDFVMNNVQEFNGRKVVSAENAKIDLEDDASEGEKLSGEAADLFTAWLRLHLEDKVSNVVITNRLHDSPAVVTDHESASIRKMMAMVNQQGGMQMPASKHVFQINPRHPIILKLNDLRAVNDELAIKVAKQIHFNSCMSAGLIDDGRVMLGDLNNLLEELLGQSLKK